MPSRILNIALLFALGAIPQPAPAQENQPVDAFHAAKAVEIGQFYMKKGDLDAAIERFLDAIRYKPNFARPRLLLGEVYEKKGEKAEAVKYYKEYLRILPKASDAGKVRKRIEKLTQELAETSPAPASVK